MTAKQSCPSAAQLQGLLAGQAPAEEQAGLAEHLETCENCRQTLEELVAGSQSWSDAARQLKEEPPTAEPKLQQIMEKIKRQAKQGATQDAATLDEEVSLDFLSPSENPDHLGRLGHYEIIEVVGQGGMGVVLKAFDTALHRIVAIKVLAPQLATTAAARKRFERETRAAAAINHEHVVAIYAVEEADGLPYFVMEFVSGVSLQERLDRTGPMELKEILRIGMQTARGLAAAHALGLVHRDIKPANILLYNGVERVKLTDFGLARAVDDASLTQSGIVAGTPQYMAPEQARGEAVDHRADLFSLGSVLYAMGAGRPPFRASTALAVLKRVSEETPRPLVQINPAIPSWLAEIIEKLHAKDPADRFQSASEVAELLGQHLAHLQQPGMVSLPSSGVARLESSKGVGTPEDTRPSKIQDVPPRHPRWAMAAAVLLPLIAGAFVVTEATGITNVTDYVGTVLRIRTSEGTLVVQVDDSDVKVSIDGEEITITGAGPQEIRLKPGKYHLQATKNGKEIPLDKDLVTITRGGKQIVKISHEGGARASAAATAQGPALAGPLDFGDYQVRFKDTLQGHTDPIWSVVFSPDGKTLATTSGELWDHPGEIRVWNVETKKPVWSRKEQSVVRAVTFSRGGMSLATGELDGTVRFWSADKGTPEGVFRGHTKAVNSVAFSPDGQTLASGSWDKTVKIWNWGTREVLDSFDSGNTDSVYSVAFSPDGKLLAVGGRDQGENHTARIFEVGSWKQPRAVLFGNKERIEYVAFSPDGELLATASWDGTVKLWRVSDGKEIMTLRGHSAAVYCVAFSPDRKLLATCSADKTVKLWDVAPRKELVQLRVHGGDFPGGNLAAVKDIITGKLVTTLSGHTDKVYGVAFSPDGKTLASASWDDTVKLWEISSNEPRGGDEIREPGDSRIRGLEKLKRYKTKTGSVNGREFIKERYVTLKHIADQTEKEFQAGRASEGDLVQARLPVLEAQRELAESDSERVKVQEQIVAQLKRLEEIQDLRFQAGRILQTDVLKARAERLQAEKDLQQLRLKAPESDKPKSDLDRLQGDWEIIRTERGGKPPSALYFGVKPSKEPLIVTIRENKLTFSANKLEATLNLDPDQIPKETDITVRTTDAANPESLTHAIYSLDGNTLTICYNVVARSQYPRDFETASDPNLELMVLRRILSIKVNRDTGEEAIQAARAQLRSMNNLKRIGLAMHSFHDVHNHFPPTALYGNGKPLLSWRVFILPFLGEEKLYKEFKLEEPWDSEHNKKLLAKMPKVFAPPTGPFGKDERTFYRALAGMVAEAGEPVPWTQPEELVYKSGNPLPKLGGLFPDRFHILLREGSVHAVKKDGFDEEKMRALLLRNEGKTTDIDELKP